MTSKTSTSQPGRSRFRRRCPSLRAACGGAHGGDDVVVPGSVAGRRLSGRTRRLRHRRWIGTTTGGSATVWVTGSRVSATVWVTGSRVSVTGSTTWPTVSVTGWTVSFTVWVTGSRVSVTGWVTGSRVSATVSVTGSMRVGHRLDRVGYGPDRVTQIEGMSRAGGHGQEEERESEDHQGAQHEHVAVLGFWRGLGFGHLDASPVYLRWTRREASSRVLPITPSRAG